MYQRKSASMDESSFFCDAFFPSSQKVPPHLHIYIHTEEIEERKKKREADAKAAQSWWSRFK